MSAVSVAKGLSIPRPDAVCRLRPGGRGRGEKEGVLPVFPDVGTLKTIPNDAPPANERIATTDRRLVSITARETLCRIVTVGLTGRGRPTDGIVASLSPTVMPLSTSRRKVCPKRLSGPRRPDI